MILEALRQMCRAILNDTNREVVRIEASFPIMLALRRELTRRGTTPTLSEGSATDFSVDGVKVVPLHIFSETEVSFVVSSANLRRTSS